MSRKKAREKIYQLTFEYGFVKEINGRTFEILTADSTLTPEDVAFIETEYNGIILHYDDIVARIMKHTPTYSTSQRLATTDLSAMIVAVYELLYSDVPPAVAINEAVDLVKVYGTEKSSGFVNGVLASILKEIQNG